MLAVESVPDQARVVAGSAGRGSTRRFWSFAVIAAYLTLGVIAFWPLGPWSSTRLFATGADGILATWFLAWIPHALSHGLNPFFSHAILVPDGVNLAQNTTSPVLGLLTTPLSPFLGAVARGNLMAVLAMPVSATAMFLVLRRWAIWEPAAALAGLIYGFSPFVVAQSTGHVVLAFLPWPPIIGSLAAKLFLEADSRYRNAVWLGVLLAVQFLSEPEIFAILVLLFGVLATCLFAVRPGPAVRLLAVLWMPCLLALGVMTALLAYPIWMELFGPQHYVGPAQGINNPYYNDLVSFIHPGSLQRFSLGFRWLNVPLSTTNGSEDGSFIGWPLVLIAVGLVWRSRHSSRMRIAALFTSVAVVLSLGRHLSINGHVTAIPLPFDLLVHLPLLDNILPTRFSFGMFLGLAAVVAFGMDDLRRHQHPRTRSRMYERRALSLASVTLLVLVASQFPRWPYPYQSAAPLPAAVRSAIPGGDPVALTYPYASPLFPEAQLWQMQQGFSFRLMGGYAEHPDVNDRSIGFPNPMHPAGLDLFLEGQEGYSVYLPPVPITSGLIDLTRRTLRLNGIRLVIVDRAGPRSGPVISLFTQVLGAPQVSDGRFAVWASRNGPL